MDFNAIITIILVSLLVESVWETLKMTWQKGKISFDRIGALVVSFVVCFGVKLDFFTLLGLGIPWWLGVALTAILISRGSTFIHDLLVRVGNITGKSQIPEQGYSTERPVVISESNNKV